MINNSVRSHGINISDAFWNQESVACLDTKPETIFPSLALGLARDDGEYFKVILEPQSYLHRDLENHSQFNCHQLALEPSDTGTVLGLVFLEGLKVIFDQTSRSVCFSSSSCGGPPVLLEGPFACDNDPMNCVHRDDVASALTAISVTMGGKFLYYLIMVEDDLEH
ncbi:Beta-secretase 1 [Gryllus bimaculatus]|nr:Beta-secretase 1 [Gryllus bimaculatus]